MDSLSKKVSTDLVNSQREKQSSAGLKITGLLENTPGDFTYTSRLRVQSEEWLRKKPESKNTARSARDDSFFEREPPKKDNRKTNVNVTLKKFISRRSRPLDFFGIICDLGDTLS